MGRGVAAEQPAVEAPSPRERSLAEQSLPEQTLSGQTLPGQTLPGQSLPGQALPEQTLPEQSTRQRLRQTTLAASAADLLTCASARVFKGSRYSSFSDAVCRLRAARGTAHAHDEHRVLDAPSDTYLWAERILELAAAQRTERDPQLEALLTQARQRALGRPSSSTLHASPHTAVS